MEYAIGIPTILGCAWVLYVTIRDPARWTYQKDTSAMKQMSRPHARVIACLAMIGAVAYWIVK